MYCMWTAKKQKKNTNTAMKRICDSFQQWNSVKLGQCCVQSVDLKKENTMKDGHGWLCIQNMKLHAV